MPWLFSVDPPMNLTQLGILYAMIMAMLAGFGILGKWLLGMVGKFIELMGTTIKEATVEIKESTELRKTTNEQSKVEAVTLEQVAKALDSAVSRQERIAAAFNEASKACGAIGEEHRKHFAAELQRLEEKRRREREAKPEAGS